MKTLLSVIQQLDEITIDDNAKMHDILKHDENLVPVYELYNILREESSDFSMTAKDVYTNQQLISLQFETDFILNPITHKLDKQSQTYAMVLEIVDFVFGNDHTYVR